jgi:hypothetical protein
MNVIRKTKEFPGFIGNFRYPSGHCGYPEYTGRVGGWK